MADPIIEDIKNRLDLAEVIGGYVQLKKAGTNFKGVCPFHHEKTASLMVSPAKQIWHCFGCNEGGDVFGFITRIEHIEFPEALRQLADRAGVQLPERRSSAVKESSDRRDRLIRINAFAAKFYHQQLSEQGGKQAKEYLVKRGLTDATINQWQIGFAPNDFHILESALKTKGVTKDELVQAGVSVANNGVYYDRFRNRVTFPIFDFRGNVVGFSARTLESDPNVAKYVNSPETQIYNKSQVLFGLNFAKHEIRLRDQALIVEGQMDCISPHQAGIKNIVATSGTALTSGHLQLIGRLTKNLVFCFDADSAGISALYRAAELALPMGFSVKVVELAGAKDPDELVRNQPGRFEELVASAAWLIDYYTSYALRAFTPNSIEQKHYVSSSIIPLIAKLPNPLDQDHYIQSIAQSFSVSIHAIRQLVAQALTATPQTGVPAQTRVAQTARHDPGLLEKHVLGGLVTSPELRELFFNDPHPEDFIHPEIRTLIETLVSEGRVNDGIINNPLAKEAAFMVESQVDLGESANSALAPGDLKKNLFALRLASLKRQQQEIAFALQSAELTKDSIAVTQARQRFAELSSLRLVYENKINDN